MIKSQAEHKYTSTGVKFWRHKKALQSYKDGTGHTVISTHISPEGSCNLSCPYCSVSKRNQHERIELSVIKDYVSKLAKRGLKAVILTGGGESTLYPQFNELVELLHDSMNLKVALITNGTNSKKVNVWDKFSWVRLSINNFPGWEDKITLPVDKLDTSCVVGLSVIYIKDNIKILSKISNIADKVNAEYIRVLPDCTLEQEELLQWHQALKDDLQYLKDPRFFQQHKIHGAPRSPICHQAYFRPYLSEINGGTVFACDSVVLNDQGHKFSEKYAICEAGDVLDFLDRKISLKFDPRIDCTGCVFTDNVMLLHNWIMNDQEEFYKYEEPLQHEEFV